MNIYLIRHAKAAKKEEQGSETDFDRPLTQAGEEQARQLAATLQQKGVQLDLVMTSPLVRAQRTAELLLESWAEPLPELKVTKHLAPDEAKPRKLARMLRETKKANVAVVAHQPDLSTWAAWLIGSKKVYIDFDKAGTAFIDWDSDLKKGTGVLQWLITPAWFEPTETATPAGMAIG